MVKRIFRSVVLVAALVLVTSLVCIMGVLYQYFNGQFQKELKSEAAYLSVGVEQNGTDYLTQINDHEKRITLIAADGTVLYDNTADIAQMENHRDREEVREAMENGSGKSSRQSSTLSEQTYYYALQLSDGNILRVSGTQYSVWRLLFGILQPIAIVFAVVLILSAVFADRAAKKIVEPINALDLERPDELEGYDELSPFFVKIRRQNRQIQKQLNEAKQKQKEFSMITENMQEGFLVINQQTELLSYNSSAMRILQSSGAGEGQSVLELNHSAPFRNTVDRVLSGEHQETELTLEGKIYRLIANPVWRHDQISGAVLVLLDVTEQVEREDLRREFTANISHELKTPLTSISGFAEIMQQGFVKPQDIEKFSGNIFTESQRLISLVNDIIKLSQLDEGSVPYEPEEVDLFSLAGQVAARLEASAGQNGVNMAVEGEHVFVKAVRPILEEVLYNLCDNAIKYNRPQGKVTVIAKQKDGKPFVSVQDTGIGIPAAEQGRVFERFYRVDKSHSKEIGGTGLGLSIVKHGAAYLGAQLTLQSRPGVGTVISLSWDQ